MQDGKYRIYHMVMKNGQLTRGEIVGEFETKEDQLVWAETPDLETHSLDRILRIYSNTPYYSIVRV